jgi:hypothetical protein
MPFFDEFYIVLLTSLFRRQKISPNSFQNCLNATKRLSEFFATPPKAKRYGETSTPTTSIYYEGMPEDYKWFRRDELVRKCVVTNAYFATMIAGSETALEPPAENIDIENYTFVKEGPQASRLGTKIAQEQSHKEKNLQIPQSEPYQNSIRTGSETPQKHPKPQPKNKKQREKQAKRENKNRIEGGGGDPPTRAKTQSNGLS